MDLFARCGYARTNTNDIAIRAGVSVGSLYQYFPNKDAILTALLERHLHAVDQVIRGSLAELADVSAPFRQTIRHMLERLLDLHDADPGLTRAVEVQVGQLPRLPQAFHELEAAHSSELARILRLRPDVRPGNKALMAALLFEITKAASAWLAHGKASAFDRDAAISEATNVICRYVEAPGG